MSSHLDNFLRVIPFSTFSIVGIIIAFRYDLWQEILQEYSEYFQVSESALIIYAILFAFSVMGTIFSIWKGIEAYLDLNHQKKQADELYLKERAALIKLFDSLGGKNWKDKTRWCSDEPIYRWKGVKLDPVTHRVNKLILPENNLSGSIPEEIGILEELIEIDFRANNIKGLLICSLLLFLCSLFLLWIGTIPKALPGLKKLEGLYLFENYIEGEIPNELAELPHLSGIYLYNNCFKDSRKSAEYFKEKLPETCYVFI